MRILTATEMQACDLRTETEFGTPTIQLMRNAASAIVRFLHLHFPSIQRLTILAGGGNNGGDGMMAAKILLDAGHKVTVYLLAIPTKGDAVTAYDELLASHPASICTISSANQISLDNTDLILDAIVGTGFKAPLRGLALDILPKITAATAPTLAIDLPSGWDADSTAVKTEAYPADAVITFTAPKPAHVTGILTRRWDAPIAVAAIGSPDAAIQSAQNWHWANSAKTITEAQRPADSNKGTFGHVLVVGGASSPTEGTKSGAPAMTALAALRSGAGLVTAAVPAAVLPLVAAIAPELMTTPLESTPLATLLHRKTVLAIGPGIGTDSTTSELIHNLLTGNTLPAVLDADALNLLAADTAQLKTLAQNRTLVLTPHPGEMSRLTGLTTAQIQANRIPVAQKFAQDHHVTLVLKGSRTIIAHPSGRIAINTSGNPAQAKGGSGDLLTGIIASLLAQHAGQKGLVGEPTHHELAVEAAVCLHGLAADLALTDHDQHTLLATDTLQYLPAAFRHHFTTNGLTYLQGR